MLCVIDLETDDLEAKEIKVGVISELNGSTSHAFLSKEDLEATTEALETTGLIGHNIIGFDLPVLDNLWDVQPDVPIFDTLILSKLLNTERKHSLKEWGKRLHNDKGEIEFSSCTIAELTNYCIQDVNLTGDVFNALIEETKEGGEWKEAHDLERKVAFIIQEQVAHGVSFDTDAAYNLHCDLSLRMAELSTQALVDLPVWELPMSHIKNPPKKQFRADGTLSFSMNKYLSHNPDWQYNSDHNDIVNSKTGEARCLPLTEPLVTESQLTLADSSRIKDWLLAEGWKPTMWNYRKDPHGKVRMPLEKTSPKLYNENKELCVNLKKLGIPAVELMAEYYTLQSRRNVILGSSGTSGWLGDKRVQREDRISARADTIGCNTHRMAHRGVANIPRVTTPYGHEMRSLFKASDGKVMIGWDAKGLEAHIEAHYTYGIDGGIYAKELIEGDVHTRNQEWMSKIFTVDRDKAKELKYALTYGAQPPRIQAILGCSKSESRLIYNKFWSENITLNTLKDTLVNQWILSGSKYIIGLDGRRIQTRSQHSLINALFQSAGAIVMKRAMVIMDEYMDWDALDAHGLIRYHDEEQWEAPLRVAEMVGDCGVQSVVQAGEFYNLNVPLEADYKIGSTWADTH